MSNNFPLHAPLAPLQYYRSYARRKPNQERESWIDTCERTVDALEEMGLTPGEADLVFGMQSLHKVFCSGRWLWVGGTEWITKPENYSGAYNCASTEITDIHAFAMQMSMAAMGTGTGVVLEPKFINQLPPVRNRLVVKVTEPIGTIQAFARLQNTEVSEPQLSAEDASVYTVVVDVGDSRQGWVDAYEAILELAMRTDIGSHAAGIRVNVRLGNVRPAGEPLKGFGGVSNPIKLTGLFPRLAEILNPAVGRNLNSLECCLLIDEAASVIVAGNIRRAAGIRQGAHTDEIFTTAKDNLWVEEDGVWSIDLKRDALRMANHTRVFHQKPTVTELIASVRKQFQSGEGAIMFAPEAIARANADIMPAAWDHLSDVKHTFVSRQ
ncbi:MAG: hypothetical protein RBJ76_13575 [Stenomitos frigidus ULC029]